MLVQLLKVLFQEKNWILGLVDAQTDDSLFD